MTEPPTSSPAAQEARRQALEAALALLRQGKRELAMQRCVAILADDPTDADALYYCAVIAIQEQQVPEGIRIIERALQVGPPQARLYNLMGQAQLRLRRPDDALLCFERAIVCDPGFADAHGNRANVLADFGRRAEALEAFDQALAVRPDNAEDLHNRAALLAELSRFPEALEGCDRALTVQPDFPDAQRLHAKLLRRLGPTQ